MPSVLDSLIDAVVDRVGLLGLTLDSTPVTVRRQKAPKVERDMEALPFISVSGGVRPGRPRWWATDGEGGGPPSRMHRYVVQITLTAPGDRDPSLNEAAYHDWRERIVRCLEPPTLLGVSELYDVEWDPDAAIDPTGYRSNYDAGRMLVELVTIEPGSD